EPRRARTCPCPHPFVTIEQVNRAQSEDEHERFRLERVGGAHAIAGSAEEDKPGDKADDPRAGKDDADAVSEDDGGGEHEHGGKAKGDEGVQTDRAPEPDRRAAENKGERSLFVKSELVRRESPRDELRNISKDAGVLVNAAVERVVLEE